MRKTTFVVLLCIMILLTSCDIFPYTATSEHGSGSTDGFIGDTGGTGVTEEADETGNIGGTGGIGVTEEQTAEPNAPSTESTVFPEDFVFPITDGSTSTLNLDIAVRNAVLGEGQSVTHTKTYTSFENLLQGKCDMIFTTPLSEAQLDRMAQMGFKHEAEPIAGEGFVFVVNKNNPIDTLTIEQIKAIYSGEITNWKELGGNDAEIIAYQRNKDSGSQNYMISFMGDTPLMEPVTDIIPASMSGILDVIVNYDNGIDSIGYSVYAYSDGMYENVSEIKYIKVNGVEPSLTTLADGSYPLLGYNYAVFSAEEAEDSNIRTLVKWIQSDEGQQIVANAGYVPYRKVEGLTLPEYTTKTLYTANSTSGVSKPEKTADYYYALHFDESDIFTAESLNEAVRSFFTEAEKELSAVDKTKMQEFIKDRNASEINNGEIFREVDLINGYLSVTAALCYWGGGEDSPSYYYEVRSAVFDIYTGKKLELSDLFFEAVEFVQILNNHIAAQAVIPYSGYGSTHEMLYDFRGLYEGEFTFTADSIIFKPGAAFADGVRISLDKIYEYMVTSIPRDMTGYVTESKSLYKIIRELYDTEACYAENKNGITIFLLDTEKVKLDEKVCNNVNGFIDEIFDTYFTEEKLKEASKEKGFEAERVIIEPWSDFFITVTGSRYVKFYGNNTASASNSGKEFEFYVLDGYTEYFRFFFDAQSGDELRIDDLFSEDWSKGAGYYLHDDTFKQWKESTWKDYEGSTETDNWRIVDIADYTHSSENGLVWIYAVTENNERLAVSVPSKYIK